MTRELLREDGMQPFDFGEQPRDVRPGMRHELRICRTWQRVQTLFASLHGDPQQQAGFGASFDESFPMTPRPWCGRFQPLINRGQFFA
jgi:hypothetical protein